MKRNNILYQYTNGSTFVTIKEDGTKIREYDERFPPSVEFPESIDIKITNYCDLNCPFCHENSNKLGKHADLDLLFDKLKDLPSGIEYAIGGGSPLSHPDLIPFMEKCKNKGWICNITTNQKHLVQYDDLLCSLISRNLVKGVGISLSKNEFVETELKWKDYEHTVIHLIAGIHNHTVVEDLIKLGFKKILILGYKQFGRGINYYDKDSKKIEQNLKEWKMYIPKYLNSCVLSFDNLSIEQLEIKRFFDKTQWDSFYMGDDFTHSMYIDAVKEEYAPTSRSDDRKAFTETTLHNFFKKHDKNKDYFSISRMR